MSTLAVALDFIRQSGYLNAEPVSMHAPRGGSRPPALLYPAPQCSLAGNSTHDASSCARTPMRTPLALHLSSTSLLAMASGSNVPKSSTSRRGKEKASALSSLHESQALSVHSSTPSDSRKRQRPTTVYTNAAMPFHMILSYRRSRRKMSAYSASAISDNTGNALDLSELEIPTPCTTCKNCRRKDCESCTVCCSKRLLVDQVDHQRRVCEMRRCLNPIHAVSSPLLRPDLITLTRNTDTSYYGGSDSSDISSDESMDSDDDDDDDDDDNDSCLSSELSDSVSASHNTQVSLSG